MLDVLELGDIEIPDIEIMPGWLARDVATVEDCDDAFALLTAACAAIEMQIDVEGFKPLQMQRGDWVARAKAALRFKKGALSIVQTRRSAINEKSRQERAETEDRRLLAFVKGALPPNQWLEIHAAFRAGTEPEKY